ncbi:phytanoyl-CoA dioxygenase family protein [Phenylobacterium sp.]|uniref:phytanoyl-CoA dioxygenase family protein n=1 Tax=Phenylobacterium sp. TaxID=1871053 RepID=UPI002DF484BF|nr:phytanoyl-CoA dioxygenase family protein [Phenylobacterium sp.]
MDEPTRDAHVTAVRERGYTIVENAIAPQLVEALAEALARLERELGARPAENPFEGHRTVRIYNLLAHGAPFAQVPVHPAVLPIVEAVLDPGCLISSLSSIAIDPGETAQPIHADDQVIPLAKPHAPLVCNSMWALTDFTEANGATRLVPGSHLSPNPEYGGVYETIAAEMPRGSVLIWDGALWHGGGANRTQARRTGVAMNYCAGFIRQQENQQLGVPPDVARGFPPRLQELMGYGVYRGLIGHIEKQSPAQRLNGGGDFRSIWDSI